MSTRVLDAYAGLDFANWRVFNGFGVPLPGGLIKADGAPAAPADLADASAAAAIANSVIHTWAEPLAHQLCAVLTHGKALADGTITPADWEKAATAYRSLFADWDTITVSGFERVGAVSNRSNAMPWNSCRAIVGERVDEAGRLVTERVGLLSYANGTDPKALGGLLTSLLEEYPTLLAENSPHVHFQSVVAGETVVVDARHRELLEDPARKWAIRTVSLPGLITVTPPRLIFREIIDEKTGDRLEDLVANADGVFFKGNRIRSSTMADHDCRSCNVGIEDRRNTVLRLPLPTEVADRIVAKAAARGVAVEQLVAECVA
ncbi:MAG TPA: hypothetical protein VK196_03320 [Magnetospirillum sp.]|nr:hypothetical protein [Magnetospirillum sp.]